MEKVCYKRLTTTGSSLAIVVPRPFAFALSVLKGDYVELVLNEDAKTITITPTRDRRLRPAQQGKSVGVAEVDA